MKPAPFDYVAAHSASEAAALLATHGSEARVLAGGQSLVPMLNLRLARPGVLVDINGAADLDYVRETDGVLAVGAVARQRALERWAVGRMPLVGEVMGQVGHTAIRNRGTVAGSIAHGDPAAELPALLLCLDGAVVTRRGTSERIVDSDRLYLAPLTTSLEAGELVTEVRFRLLPPSTGWGFAEVARRHGDFALAGAIATLRCDQEGSLAQVRLAMFGVGATPVRARAAEALLSGRAPTAARLAEASRAAAAELSPDSDLHATADYRRRVGAVLAERTLTAALGRARGPR